MSLPTALVGAGLCTAAGAFAAITLANVTGHGDLALSASAAGGALASFGGWRLASFKIRDPNTPSSVTKGFDTPDP